MIFTNNYMRLFMDKVQEVNDKLAVITIIIGFILGIYLGIGHDDPNLWWNIVEWIFMTAFIMTFIPTVVGLYANIGDGEEFTILSPIRVFALNFAMLAVSASFGFVFCSILIGNYNTAN